MTRWLTTLALVALWIGLTAYLSGPTETDAAAATAADKADAINQARVAIKEQL
jgi:hypothetical protein